MTSPTRLSRLARRRAEELAQPPRPQWRLLGMLPLLALAMLVAGRATMAWFTDAKPLAAPIATGQWSTLMAPDQPGPLVISAGATSGSITTHNTSNADLFFRAEWAQGSEGGGTITVVDDATGQPLAGGILPAGHTARITVSGAWPDSWTGYLRLSIGTGYFDERGPAVTVTVTKVPDIVTITGVCFFGSGTPAPQNNWVQILTAAAKTNLPPALQNQTLIVTRTAAVSYMGTPEPPAIKVSPTEPTATPTSSMSSDTWVNQAATKIWSGTSMTPKYYPTTVELTVTAQDPNIKGSMKVYYVIGQSSDINAIQTSPYSACPDQLYTYEIKQKGNEVVRHNPGETAPAALAPSVLGGSALQPEVITLDSKVLFPNSDVMDLSISPAPTYDPNAFPALKQIPDFSADHTILPDANAQQEVGE